MKILKQFSILLGFLVVGQLLEELISYPIPATIYALVLLLLTLKFQFLQPKHLQETSEFLVEHMSLLFIPPTVSLMRSWSSLSKIIVPVLIMIVLSTLIVMVSTGLVTQKIMEKKNERTL